MCIRDSYWVTQQARNVPGGFADADVTAKFLVLDRDTKFVASFDEVFGAEGTQIMSCLLYTSDVGAPCTLGLDEPALGPSV